MRKVFLMALLALAGCQNTIGPFASRSPQRVDDPRISIPEQEYRGRDRWAIPQEAPAVGPSSGNIYRPGQ
jgi:hypothetical protein